MGSVAGRRALVIDDAAEKAGEDRRRRVCWRVSIGILSFFDFHVVRDDVGDDALLECDLLDRKR